MANENHCLFCKIIRGDIPSATVFETDQAVAFLDINPVNKGHLLLLPRAHHPTLADLPDDLASHLGSLLPRLCRAISRIAGSGGLNVITNNGRIAGQTIDHLHWHIIPRHVGDAVHWPWTHVAYSDGEMADLRNRLERALRSPIP